MIDGSGIPIRIASEYASMNTSAANVNPAMEVPDIGHILFENIKDTGKNDHGMQFVGLKESELHDFIFRGVSAKENGCLNLFIAKIFALMNVNSNRKRKILKLGGKYDISKYGFP